MHNQFYRIFIALLLFYNSAFAAKHLDYCLSPSSKDNKAFQFEMMEGEDFFKDTQIWELYDRSFSDDEKVDIERLRHHLTKKSTRGFMLRLVTSGRTLGLMYYTLRENLNFAFVGYLAIDPELQGKGYGQALFNCGMETSKRQFLAEGRDSIGMVLEVEKPETAESPQDRSKREAVLRFYTKFNGLILPIDYYQPALSETQGKIPMFLLHIPLPGQHVNSSYEFAKRIFDIVMDEIYSG
jgi:GNAT superfamily N-acetyltransferase